MTRGILFTSEDHVSSPSSTIIPSNLLTPENCVSTKRIKAFLRLSRIATDDSIRERLNELKGANACDSYFQSTIIPQWNARSQVIQYCSNYANQLRSNSTSIEMQQVPDLNSRKNEDDPYNLRLDPYAFKKHTEVIQSRFALSDQVEGWVHNEQAVETIVRDETIKILNDKCTYKNWLQLFFEASK